jgi:hypothetical protein
VKTGEEQGAFFIDSVNTDSQIRAKFAHAMG